MTAPIDPLAFSAALAGNASDQDFARREPRWLVRRRAEAAAALVRAEAVPVEAACRHYGLTPAQFEGHRRASQRFA